MFIRQNFSNKENENIINLSIENWRDVNECMYD